MTFFEAEEKMKEGYTVERRNGTFVIVMQGFCWEDLSYVSEKSRLLIEERIGDAYADVWQISDKLPRRI